MSSSKIRYVYYNSPALQNGYGVPDHIEPLGSIYVDNNDGIVYVNKDGLVDWVTIIDTTYPLGTIAFTGGTVNGPTNFTNGLTASTMSASTYYGDGSNLTGIAGSIFTGGTVTGPTRFNAGLTANTISATSINKVDYIVFNTGTTSAATVAGTVYFDNTEKALSYNTSINQGVTVNLGQQNYLRVFNNSGLDIQKGKCVELLSSYSGLPAIQLAVNRHYNDKDVVGVSAEIIPNNSEGIVLTYGIISNITVTGASIGSLVYASDTTPGEFKNSTEFLNFPLTARTNAVGYIIQTGTTTGKLFVNPVNENNNLSLTELQRNILEGNAISTGVFSFGGISLASSTTFNVGPAEGWIVDNTTNPLVPDVFYVKYTGQTNIPSLYYSSATQTYLLLTSAGTLTQQVTYPTPQQRRQSIYLAKMGHGNRTSLINAFNEPDFEISPISQIRDMFTPIKLINENVYPSPNTGLTFNTSSGILWGLGIGFATDVLNPSSITISGNSPTTFQYRTQTGGTATNRTTIDPANYDLNGVITTIGSPAKQATNQRIYLLQNGQFRLQYGQTVYADLTAAIAAVTNESFTTFSNFKDNAILIGILSVRSDATLLSDVLQAKITFASKFGESVGGTGGISTTNLQQAYNNSAQPEIVTNSAEGALSIKNGTGNADNITNLLECLNAAGNTTSFIRADGDISGTTLQTNGFRANNNGLTATTISATTYLNLPSSTFTGGTVTGATNFTSTLTANSLTNTGTGGLTILGNQSLTLAQGNQNVGIISVGTSSPPSVVYNDGRTITSTRFIGNATPLSGSNWNYNQISIETVVNTSNNSNGKFRGIYINPSLTMSGTNNEYLAIEVVTGKTRLDTLITNTISATTMSGNSLILSSSASTINLNNPNQQQIRFFNGGTGVPTYNTYSSGAKIILSDNIDSISSGYAIGVDAGSLWYGADLAGNGHDWYAGTRKLMSLTSSSGLELIGLGGPGTTTLTISGTSALGSKGGVGYVDFLKVVNNSIGATNINKWFRVNQTGAMEIINSTYTATTFSISDNGIVTITGPASVTSNSATNNALNIGSKGQLFDDGNLHIHANSGSVWINSLDGNPIRLGTQTNTGNSTVIVDTTTVGHSFFTKVQSSFNVAFGTEITMDNLKVRINGTGGSAGLVQAGAVSGSFAAYTTLLGNVAGAAVQGDTNSGGITFTTTYQNISGIQKTLSAGGDTTTLHLIDTTNSRIYRITAIHCQGTTGGYTSIERMA